MLDEEARALLRPRFESLGALLSEPPMQPAFGRLVGRILIGRDTLYYSEKLGWPHKGRNPTFGITE